jgi:hypothetical protein
LPEILRWQFLFIGSALSFFWSTNSVTTFERGIEMEVWFYEKIEDSVILTALVLAIMLLAGYYSLKFIRRVIRWKQAYLALE